MSLLRFGTFEFDPATPELRRNGRRVPLQDMPLRVLQMLLEHPNELVPRETFFGQLWPDDETGILDDNLNTAVRKLRLALNDSAHHPRFIETVPKRGYRFLAAVGCEGEQPEASAGTLSSAAAAVPRARWNTTVRVLVPLALVLGGVLVYFLVGHRAQEVPSRASAQAKTLAVLPFVNATGDPADEYFSQGLSEELMDRLARTGDLRVVSRTSVFALKGRNLGAREVGDLLGTGSLVEGSVRREGDRVRINVRLVSASDGLQLWSQAYDRRLTDVIGIQEEIAQAIASTLSGRLRGEPRGGTAETALADPLAYDQYLKGRFYWHRRTEQSLRAAVEHFETAVRHAPEYAPAWAGLGDAYAVLGFYDYLPPTEAFPKAQEAARRALQLDANNASAEATLGYAALYFDWDLVSAEERFRRSIDLDPNNSKAHQWYGNLLTAAGRFDEAEREMRRAQQLEPLSLIASAALGWSLYHAGRYEQAIEQYRLTLALDPQFELAYLWSGWALEALGRYDDALEMLNEAVKRSSGSGISTASLARVHALRGEPEEARRILSKLIQSDRYLPSYEISKAWLALGASAEAQQWLQRALEQRSHSLVFLKVDPQLAGHREDPTILRIEQRVAH